MQAAAENLTPKQDRAILALIQATSLKEAATLAGINEATLFRWLQLPAFRDAYQKARRETVGQAIAKLQAASSGAVSALQGIAENIEAPASARVSAAKTILDLSLKAVEMESIEERLTDLERRINGGK